MSNVAEVTERWDEWFLVTGDDESLRAWRAAKDVFVGDGATLERWAALIDMNRIDRAIQQETPPVFAGGVQE